MKGEMIAAVMPKTREIEMQKRPIPVPKDNEVLVKIKHVGLCGSDMHFYEYGRIGSVVMDSPTVLGHESAGEIVEVGKNVKNLSVGDRVALEPGVPCGKCEFCKEGKYNLCPDVAFMACPGYDGAFAEYVAYPSDMAFKLPANVDTVEGGLIEPLAVGFHAVSQSGVRAGQKAVVLGSGCIGLVTLMVLKMIGVSEVYVVDVIAKRLEMAKELGATKVLKADEVDVEKTIKELTGNGADAVFETAGNKITTLQTAHLVKSGGVVTIVGMGVDPVIPYDISALVWKEATIKTVFRYRNLYPTAIKAVAAGQIPLKKIATHYFDFANLKEAIDYNIENKSEVIKAVIKFE
ncbi:MAG TPA: NAD(P)-dependent alcohol dehydrogenase [Clostridia bacterium]|nr:NAD(P)-dependent alcohol dehydrogenase [Clostridia bacterium]